MEESKSRTVLENLSALESELARREAGWARAYKSSETLLDPPFANLAHAASSLLGLGLLAAQEDNCFLQLVAAWEKTRGDQPSCWRKRRGLASDDPKPRIAASETSVLESTAPVDDLGGGVVQSSNEGKKPLNESTVASSEIQACVDSTAEVSQAFSCSKAAAGWLPAEKRRKLKALGVAAAAARKRVRGDPDFLVATARLASLGGVSGDINAEIADAQRETATALLRTSSIVSMLSPESRALLARRGGFQAQPCGQTRLQGEDVCEGTRRPSGRTQRGMPHGMPPQAQYLHAQRLQFLQMRSGFVVPPRPSGESLGQPLGLPARQILPGQQPLGQPVGQSVIEQQSGLTQPLSQQLGQPLGQSLGQTRLGHPLGQTPGQELRYAIHRGGYSVAMQQQAHGVLPLGPPAAPQTFSRGVPNHHQGARAAYEAQQQLRLLDGSRSAAFPYDPPHLGPPRL